MIESYATRHEAAHAAADSIVRSLRQDLRTQSRASLVVSGGSTPQECLELLARHQADWDRVDVTLTDERQVPSTDPASNEGMLRRHLFVEHAARARFVPVEEEALGQLALPTSVVLCGMGTDGHFASLFPDVANLQELLDLDNPNACAAITTAASPHPRTSLTLAWLCRTRSVLLLVFGPEKRAVLDDPQDTPVGYLLRQTQCPVRILWAP